VEILNAPSNGILRDVATGDVLSSGDNVSTILSSTKFMFAALSYQGHKGYFNKPSTKWNGAKISGGSGIEDDLLTFRVRVYQKAILYF
jgi:hypothetical protein